LYGGFRDDPLEGTAITKRLQRHLEAAGLPRIRFHDLRHSAASMWISAGVPIRVVADMLGYSNIGLTLNTYAHASTDMQREAAKTMGRLLGG
jgi:integrase